MAMNYWSYVAKIRSRRAGVGFSGVLVYWLYGVAVSVTPFVSGGRGGLLEVFADGGRYLLHLFGVGIVYFVLEVHVAFVLEGHEVEIGRAHV